jgi:hypothetical protein
MYYTFVLFVNQHFPWLPANGTHCITLTSTFSVHHSYQVVQITWALDLVQSDIQKAFHRIISRYSYCLTTGACMTFSPVHLHSTAPFTSLIIHRIKEANKNRRSELVPFPVTAVRAVISSLWNWRSTYVLCKLQVIKNVCQHILNSLYNFYRASSPNMGHVMVKALCYKPERRGIENRWGQWNFFFNLSNPSGCTRPWGVLSL